MLTNTMSLKDLTFSSKVDSDIYQRDEYYVTYDPDKFSLYNYLNVPPEEYAIVLTELESRSYGLLRSITSRNIFHRLSIQQRSSYFQKKEIDLILPESCALTDITIDDSSTYYGSRDQSIILSFVADGNSIVLRTPLYILEKANIVNIQEDLTCQILNVKAQFSAQKLKKLLFRDEDDFQLNLENITTLFHYSTDEKNRLSLLEGLVNSSKLPGFPTKGITKMVQKCSSYYQEVLQNNLLQAAAFRTLCYESNRTIQSVKVSSMVNDLFKSVDTYADFETALQSIVDIYFDQCSSYYQFESIFEQLNGFSDKRKTALKSKSTGAFNKMMADLDFVDINETEFPLTHRAITEGDLPLSVFFRKSESYFLFNDNWCLWEEMLEKHYDIALELAETVKGRTTYEKDLMSYMHFVLHSLPEYLEKHTGKKWTGIPKLVNSSSELDPPKEGDNGIAKQRSALTPIVDNEACTITVPYASLALSGYSTTYCYSLNYTVLTRGLSIDGNVCTKDIEEKLNGKDDYGLMFYTLTGSSQGRGYPTFLIIFERLEEDTFVHFHRTHPMRSKDGDYNPLHQWTKGAYKWMSGNVNFERIVVQQGDLVFVRSLEEHQDKAFTSVNAYDSHRFAEPVLYAPYEKKQKENILGYFKIDKPVELLHLEHLDVLIPEGLYELRQCRSWEANPKGVWSLRID